MEYDYLNVMFDTEAIVYPPHYNFLFKSRENLQEGCHDVPWHVLRLEPRVSEAEEHEAVLSVLDEVGNVQGQRVGGLWCYTVIMMFVVSVHDHDPHHL